MLKAEKRTSKTSATLATYKKYYALINNKDFHMADIQCGVPYGSILDPLFFLLYVNDVINCSSNKPILSADNTCLTVKDTSIENVKLKIKNENQMFTQLVNTNKLTLNISKSNVVILPFHSKQYTHPIFSFTDLPELFIVKEKLFRYGHKQGFEL